MGRNHQEQKENPQEILIKAIVEAKVQKTHTHNTDKFMLL